MVSFSILVFDRMSLNYPGEPIGKPERLPGLTRMRNGHAADSDCEPRSQRLESTVSMVEHREVVDTGDVRSETRVASSRFVFSPGQILGGALGVVVAIIGIIAVSRGGIDGSLNVPVVNAAGTDQSAMLGLFEFALGLLLVLGALSYAARGLIAFVGVVMIVGGVVLGAAGSTILRDVGTSQGTGWAIMVGGIIAVVAASLGRIIRTSRSVERV